MGIVAKKICSVCQIVCLFVCIWGHLLWRRDPIEGPRSIPNMPCQLQVVAGIILAASPRCFPYTIAKSAMWDTAVGIWSALERGNQGQHRPGWTPRVRQGAILTTGLVRTLLGHQLSSRWTPVHKPSSNSGNPVAWFTDSATKSCLSRRCLWMVPNLLSNFLGLSYA